MFRRVAVYLGFKEALSRKLGSKLFQSNKEISLLGLLEYSRIYASYANCYSNSHGAGFNIESCNIADG